MVSKILGGPFTFLGQYEDEGIMIMVRRADNSQSEEGEENLPPLNLHKLQPPFHNAEVRGDILLMRVAPTNEEDDDANEDIDDKEDVDNAEKEGKIESNEEESESKGDNDEEVTEEGEGPIDTHVPSNDEFFLDYTKEEYLKFASRTDIVAKEEESEEESEEEAE
eukprot:1871950-Ditylum_brightwellii.AAC.1